ncbi:MAG: GAF domain-containing protein [Ktedonobacteraceae bacterium]|nr:GAF domain-containing protein [Ktedonobacteraceae bacterium]
MPERDWSEFRALLKSLWQDTTTRKLIEQRADISARTLARWASGETEKPDKKYLSRLVHALPHHRDALLTVIVKAMPDFDVPLVDTTQSQIDYLPHHFMRLLEINANAPKNLHFSAVIDQIFLQLQSYIDPERIGVQLILAQCSSPCAPDRPIRSMRQIKKIQTHQSLPASPTDHIFLGAESLAGYSVGMCQTCIVQDVQRERRLPVLRKPDVSSLAAYPIQRGGYVAGCFLSASPQPDFFSQRLQGILRIYAYLLSIAFESDQFYAPEQIRLCPMPTECVQHPYIAQFQDRVLALLRCEPFPTRSEAETQVWQQIEEALVAASNDM